MLYLGCILSSLFIKKVTIASYCDFNLSSIFAFLHNNSSFSAIISQLLPVTDTLDGFTVELHLQFTSQLACSEASVSYRRAPTDQRIFIFRQRFVVRLPTAAWLCSLVVSQQKESKPGVLSQCFSSDGSTHCVLKTCACCNSLQSPGVIHKKRHVYKMSEF